MKNLATIRPLYKGNPESPLGNLTADGLVWMAQKYRNVDADVSIYNSGGIRNSFNKGDITLEDVYAVYPFDNVLTILTMKGSDLKTLFNYVASYDGMPINSAVRLVIDQSRNIKSLTINGQAIQDNKTYTMSLSTIWPTLENMVLTNTLPALTALSTYETTLESISNIYLKRMRGA